MKALISPNQNNLVVEVVAKEFDVALPLYWVDCDETITAYGYVYLNGSFEVYEPPQPTAQENKEIATKLLYETDWTSIPDVGNPELSNPYLINQTEFLAWRSQIRAIAVNPTAGYIVFPTKPKEQWS